MQQRPGLVDRQVEALDENAGGMERSIVTALAGDGRRDLGQVGRRPGQPVVSAAAGADTGEAVEPSCARAASSSAQVGTGGDRWSVRARRVRSWMAGARHGRFEDGESSLPLRSARRRALCLDFEIVQPGGQVKGGGEMAGARGRRLRAPGLVVPGRTVHSSGEPPLRSIRLAGVRSADSPSARDCA